MFCMRVVKFHRCGKLSSLSLKSLAHLAQAEAKALKAVCFASFASFLLVLDKDSTPERIKERFQKRKKAKKRKTYH